jgi:formate hydrogenlyase transcriptional activator
MPLLARPFVQFFFKCLHRVIESIPACTMDALTGRRWSANVRELRNVLERAVILSPGPVLQMAPRDRQAPNGPALSAGRAEHTTARTWEAVERAPFGRRFTKRDACPRPYRGGVDLGITRQTLQFRKKRWALDDPARAWTRG